ncbi:phage tail protein [Paludibacter sp.]|uniref:phage tail protein n=1 Tax=Paludibacter sp. TaxID=1898105 RepID=UPI001354263A|nr:phage tail protein [Paludibacter sp.]MTK53598.1 tail fiber protein [Paludibacter sp.]
MEPYVGTIKLFPFAFAPVGWLLCNGASVSNNTYQALYSLIGTKYGGTATSFQLPNLTNTAPTSPSASVQQMAYYIAVTGLYPSRS